MAPFQVEKLTLKSSVASQYENPIETNKRGEITGIVLSVPVYTERNAFLVVHIPQPVVQQLINSVASKPESERAQFIREWIKQNQLAIYDQYMSSGSKTMGFNFEVVTPKLAGLKPRPAEISAQSLPRKVEPPPKVFPVEKKESIQERKAPVKEAPIIAKPPEARKETKTEPPPVVRQPEIKQAAKTEPPPPAFKAPEKMPEPAKPQFSFRVGRRDTSAPQAPEVKAPEKKPGGEKIAMVEPRQERPAAPSSEKTSSSQSINYFIPLEMRPVPAGGTGAQGDPYTIRVPISAPKMGKGDVIKSTEPSFINIGGVGMKYFQVEFVAAGESPAVSKEALIFRMKMLAADMIRKDLERDKKNLVTPDKLEQYVKTALQAGSKSNLVSSYMR